MQIPNLFPGSIFTDHNIDADRQPHEALAELRRIAPIDTDGYDRDGYRAVTTHVTSRQSDCLNHCWFEYTGNEPNPTT